MTKTQSTVLDHFATQGRVKTENVDGHERVTETGYSLGRGFFAALGVGWAMTVAAALFREHGFAEDLCLIGAVLMAFAMLLPFLIVKRSFKETSSRFKRFHT